MTGSYRNQPDLNSTENRDDARHLEQVLAGNPQHVERWIATLERIAMGVAIGQYRFSRADAEDVFSGVFEKLWRDDQAVLRRWSGQGSLNAYLNVIVNSFCLMELRRRRRSGISETEEVPEVPVPPAIDSKLERASRDEALKRGLSRLSESDRQLITDRYLKGLEYGQISERTGRTYGALRKAMHIALRRLRDQMGDPQSGEPSG